MVDSLVVVEDKEFDMDKLNMVVVDKFCLEFVDIV